jgi:hypothetical protein
MPPCPPCRVCRADRWAGSVRKCRWPRTLTAPAWKPTADAMMPSGSASRPTPCSIWLRSLRPPGPALPLHRPLDGLHRKAHADFLGDPERPLTGRLEMPEHGRAVTLGGCLLRVGHRGPAREAWGLSSGRKRWVPTCLIRPETAASLGCPWYGPTGIGPRFVWRAWE